jgi:hypothetical protein
MKSELNRMLALQTIEGWMACNIGPVGLLGFKTWETRAERIDDFAEQELMQRLGAVAKLQAAPCFMTAQQSDQIVAQDIRANFRAEVEAHKGSDIPRVDTLLNFLQCFVTRWMDEVQHMNFEDLRRLRNMLGKIA